MHEEAKEAQEEAMAKAKRDSAGRWWAVGGGRRCSVGGKAGGRVAVGGSRQAPTKNIHTKSTYHCLLPAACCLARACCCCCRRRRRRCQQGFWGRLLGLLLSFVLGDNQ